MTVTRQLTVQQAEITTASIEIKALTLNRKQVTLSAFRQLLEEDLVLENGTLAGIPWGFINYHPDKCGDPPGNHFHVVWQKGNELRRGRVLAPGFRSWPRFWAECGDEFISASKAASGRNPDWVERAYEPEDGEWYYGYTVAGLRCISNHEWRTSIPTDGIWSAQDLKELNGEIHAAAVMEKARRAAVETRCAELALLPQLFIAV